MRFVWQDDAYEDEAFVSEDESFEADQVADEAMVSAVSFGELSYENEFDDELKEETLASTDDTKGIHAVMSDSTVHDENIVTNERAEATADKSDETADHSDAASGNATKAAGEGTNTVSTEKKIDTKSQAQEFASTSVGKSNITPPSSPALSQDSPRLSISVSLVPQEPRNSVGIAAGAVALALAANPTRSSPVDFERLDVTHTPRKSSPFISRLPSVGEIAITNTENGSDSSESSSDEDEPSPQPPPRVFISQTHRASLESAKSWTDLLQSAVLAPPIARERSKSQPFITRLSSVSEIVIEDTPDEDAAEETKQKKKRDNMNRDDQSFDAEESLVTKDLVDVPTNSVDRGTKKVQITADPSTEKDIAQGPMVDVPLVTSEDDDEGKSKVLNPLEGNEVSGEPQEVAIKRGMSLEKDLSLGESHQPSLGSIGPADSTTEDDCADEKPETPSAQDGPHWSRQSSEKSVSEVPSEEGVRDEPEQKNPPVLPEMEMAISIAPEVVDAESSEEFTTDESSFSEPTSIEKDEENAEYDDEYVDEATCLAQEDTEEDSGKNAVVPPMLDGLIDEDADDDDYDYEEQEYEEDDSDGMANDKHPYPANQVLTSQEYEDQEDLYETEEQSRRETELLLLEAEQLIRKQHEENAHPSPSKEYLYDDDQDIEEQDAEDSNAGAIRFTEASELLDPTPEERNDVEYDQDEGEEECNYENTPQRDEPETSGRTTEAVCTMGVIQSEDQVASDAQKTINTEEGSSYDGDDDFTHEERNAHLELQKLEAKSCVQESVLADESPDQLISGAASEQMLRAAKPPTERSVNQTRSRPSPPTRAKTEAAPSPSKLTLTRKPTIPSFRSTRVLRTLDGAISTPTVKEDESSKAEEVSHVAALTSAGSPRQIIKSSPPKQAFPPQSTPGGHYTLFVEQQPQLPRKAPVPKQPRSIKKSDAKETKKKLKPVKSPPHLRIELPTTMEKSKRDWLFLNMFRHGDDVSKYEPFVPNAAKFDAKHGARRPVSARRLIFGAEQMSADTVVAAYSGSAGFRRGRHLVSQDSNLRARERAWVATKPHESTIPAYDSILDKYCATVTSPVIQRQIYQTRQRDLSPQLAYVLERRVEKQWDHGSSESFGAVSTSYKTQIVPLGFSSGIKKA